MPLGITADAHKARLGRPGARYYAGPAGALTSEQMFNGGSSTNKRRMDADFPPTKDFPEGGKEETSAAKETMAIFQMRQKVPFSIGREWASVKRQWSAGRGKWDGICFRGQNLEGISQKVKRLKIYVDLREEQI
ncbi:uncharacterized protein CEXT_539501 [Caerostris extrusa]|uniref:Uncharacterized protein n=1 Tax=Caerostris extrusa TaxID=172846 RepID=A0AAV4RIW5_CAEEX|nr:uncharacterized protein CEXT_539501 [Caerostris extrusa]